ncbi:GNAT family N-acetyltransferase [Sphingobacterium sp. SRCM116780]|uniref:GNAT family N-acetyltransferase n=1 Tax=Sphingobacterium sp. SRCM116780 TaxID=2907623 RepID=UPI001F320FB3|nr:GNAT family N-acetyltransferase [Sphingobacterium sp. SRCM116780]UIR56273.1 GNAT family N-acetyltransferase [Sphingobacterium sp. SRCM116780]
MNTNLSGVSLITYEDKHFEKLTYPLDEIQSQFTKSVYQNIVVDEILNNKNKFPITILYRQEPVGFFVLDKTADHLLVTANPFSILLRGLSINPDFQGKGIAKQALLLLNSFVKTLFPGINEIVLTVNTNNMKAYHLYLHIGYIDTGRFKEGRYGLQHMLFKRI